MIHLGSLLLYDLSLLESDFIIGNEINGFRNHGGNILSFSQLRISEENSNQ